MSQFKITGGRGFHMTLGNGYTISVQFGGGNYSGNYDEPIVSCVEKNPPSETAEVAVLIPHGICPRDKLREVKGGLLQLPGWDDTVYGYADTTFVVNLIAQVAAWRVPESLDDAMAPWAQEAKA